MSKRKWSGRAMVATAAAVMTVSGSASSAQNHAPNPYLTVDGWAKLPAGRQWGATSAVYPARDGSGNIWVAERCGSNTCVDSDEDPILLFDPSGNLIRSFGAGMIVWPHGIFVDQDNNVWVTDAVGIGADTPEGRGHVVLKFSPDGEPLMRLGRPGISGDGPDTFNRPSDVLVAPNGTIFVADGHDAGGNNRTQIFDQDGNYLATWTQFGRPSGLFIDETDTLYSADSESGSRIENDVPRHPGWKRGIRIGSAVDGLVTAFIPDPEPDQAGAGTSAAEGVAVDAQGNVYGAEVGPRTLKKYVKR